MQLFENRICGGGPLEGLAVDVVGCDELIDALHELFDAGERAAADHLANRALVGHSAQASNGPRQLGRLAGVDLICQRTRRKGSRRTQCTYDYLLQCIPL